MSPGNIQEGLARVFNQAENNRAAQEVGQHLPLSLSSLYPHSDNLTELSHKMSQLEVEHRQPFLPSLSSAPVSLTTQAKPPVSKLKQKNRCVQCGKRVGLASTYHCRWVPILIDPPSLTLSQVWRALLCCSSLCWVPLLLIWLQGGRSTCALKEQSCCHRPQTS